MASTTRSPQCLEDSALSYVSIPPPFLPIPNIYQAAPSPRHCSSGSGISGKDSTVPALSLIHAVVTGSKQAPAQLKAEGQTLTNATKETQRSGLKATGQERCRNRGLRTRWAVGGWGRYSDVEIREFQRRHFPGHRKTSHLLSAYCVPVLGQVFPMFHQLSLDLHTHRCGRFLMELSGALWFS